MSCNLNINPKQRDQEILDMQEKFYQKLGEKSLEMFRLKQKLRETENEKNQDIFRLKQKLREMNRKYGSPYESSTLKMENQISTLNEENSKLREIINKIVNI